jgi:predicted transcriptional regulator
MMKRRLEWPELTEEEKHRMTLEALADVDAGRVVDHAEVEGLGQKP